MKFIIFIIKKVMRKNKACIIFVKHPEVGKVKTRLASTTNENFAVKIYKTIAEHIFDEIEKLSQSVDAFVFYSEKDSPQTVKEWVSKNYVYKAQKGNTLGEKMSNAFEHVFSLGYEKALIVGSDVPDISELVLDTAFNSLRNNDIVISPSDDGGYSLLGMKNYFKNIFDNIEWSTNSVFSKTEEKAKDSNLKLKILSTLNDIDTEDELKEWISYSKNRALVEKIETIAGKEVGIL